MAEPFAAITLGEPDFSYDKTMEAVNGAAWAITCRLDGAAAAGVKPIKLFYDSTSGSKTSVKLENWSYNSDFLLSRRNFVEKAKE